jgi:hypothetical protein
MAILDIVFAESDDFILELGGVSGTVLDIVYDNPLIEEIVGVNGVAIDVLFDENPVNEIPSVKVTDFVFL